MNRQLFRLDLLFLHSLLNESFCQSGRFAVGHHPAHPIAAEDIQDDIKIEVGPFVRAMQFSNVPRPQLVCPGRQQFGLAVVGVAQLVAAFSDFGMVLQDALHGANRTEKSALIQQGGIDLLRRLVYKTLAVQ